jgi:uncharacterized protein (TIGR01777 family)
MTAGGCGFHLGRPLVTPEPRPVVSNRHVLLVFPFGRGSFRINHDRSASLGVPHMTGSPSLPTEVTLRHNVAITGATGLVGFALVASFESSGQRVLRLVRGASKASNDESIWDPGKGVAAPERLNGLQAVVHLAGENIAGRWTEAKKRRIRDSRVAGTTNLCRTLASLHAPPKVLVCASAIGYYGDRGDEILDESSSQGSGFLPDVCREWEAATEIAANAGIRVVNARLGVVLSRRGGALKPMLLPFKLGAGGKVGSGQQYWSWIDLDDVVAAIRHAIESEGLFGPVNVVAPHPCTNAEFTKVLGKVLHRPTVIPMPAFAARLALGEMADGLLLASARVIPRKLQETGFEFRFTDLAAALRHELA